MISQAVNHCSPKVCKWVNLTLNCRSKILSGMIRDVYEMIMISPWGLIDFTHTFLRPVIFLLLMPILRRIWLCQLFISIKSSHINLVWIKNRIILHIILQPSRFSLVSDFFSNIAEYNTVPSPKIPHADTYSFGTNFCTKISGSFHFFFILSRLPNQEKAL